MHVAARRGGPGVDVGVGVHPNHTSVGFGLQVSGEGAMISGAVDFQYLNVEMRILRVKIDLG